MTAMRIMMMVKATKDYEAGMPRGEALMAAMGKLTGEMMQAGAVLASEGLQPSSRAHASSTPEGRGRSSTDLSPKPRN
ncbi:MAG: hypothetical protein ACREUU_12270 [Gammaproteobacteria bacterium]